MAIRRHSLVLPYNRLGQLCFVGWLSISPSLFVNGASSIPRDINAAKTVFDTFLVHVCDRWSFWLLHSPALQCNSKHEANDIEEATNWQGSFIVQCSCTRPYLPTEVVPSCTPSPVHHDINSLNPSIQPVPDVPQFYNASTYWGIAPVSPLRPDQGLFIFDEPGGGDWKIGQKKLYGDLAPYL